MNLGARIQRWHSPTVFTFIALCFLLPFATVFTNGCQSSLQSSTKFTGAQLVTHTVPQGSKDTSCDRWRRSPVSPERAGRDAGAAASRCRR